MLVSLAPAGRNIYSHGITKPEAPSERHRNEHTAPLGLLVVWVGGYKDVAPLELKAAVRLAVQTAALIQWQWGQGEADHLFKCVDTA